MKLLSTLAVTAASLTIFAGEIIMNNNFSDTEPLSDSRKQDFAKTQTVFSGSRIPRYWNIAALQNKDANKISFTDSRKVTVETPETSAGIAIYGRNYRVTRGQIGSNDLKFTIAASGTGRAVCGMYCYNAQGRYMTTLKFEPVITFKEGDKVQSIQIAGSVLPEKAQAFVPRVIFSGSLEISKISCDTVKVDDSVKKKL